tara:strand:- start:180 stop:812 length:633 start_codon:yes stop_codon:yes gene_type:complete
MSSTNDGMMIVLSSPSGVGKTTLVKKIAFLKKFKISISYTTRKSRTDEEDGKDYYFIEKKDFEKLIKKNELLEHANVFNHYYGTSKEKVLLYLKNGNNVLFDIDWQGAKQIKNKKLDYKIITVFILPPSRQELFSRLSNRDMKDKLIAEQRMKLFNDDVVHWKEYDYVVINDSLERCCEEIIEYIELELKNSKKKYNRELIEKHVDFLIN